MRVLVFGDSIAQGFWAAEGGWVERLRKHYDKRQIKDLFTPSEPHIFNLGISGDITTGVIKRLANETEARKWRWPHEKFAFVVAIGINDAVMEEGTERSSADKYQSELKTLLQEVNKFSDRVMFVGLTPIVEHIVNDRLWKSKRYLEQRVIEFDEVLKEFCVEQKVPYVHLHQPMKERMDAGHSLFDDGLHPNDAGHEFIFQLIRPELDKLLAA